MLQKRKETSSPPTERFEWKIGHVIPGLFLALVISYLFLSSGNFVAEAGFTFVIFNFLFVLITFPISGRLVTKVLLLLLGNLVGFLWNCFFMIILAVENSALSDFFCQFFCPLLNLIWIVAFYSVSLTVLSSWRNE